MSILEKLKQQTDAVRGAATDVGRTAVRQTKSLASIGKTKVAIASEEDKLKKAYAELGRLCYQDYEAGTEPDPAEYQIWYDKIAEVRGQVQRLTEDISRIREEAAAQPVVEEIPEEEQIPDIEVVLEETASEEAAAEEPEQADEAAEQVSAAVDAAVDALQDAEEPPVGTLYLDETEAE